MRQRMGLVLVGLVLAAPPAWATTYTLDQDHTTVSFKIRHLFSNVEGTFNKFQGTFDYVPGQPELWKAQAVIEAASIDTRVEQRDTHLRSPDFFDVEQYPVISFTSTGVSEEGATLDGLLMIRGVERPVTLDLVVHGEGKDPWGNLRSGFTATTTIDRRDFGLTWNAPLETGQFLVGEEVEITLEVEGLVQGEAVPVSE